MERKEKRVRGRVKERKKGSISKIKPNEVVGVVTVRKVEQVTEKERERRHPRVSSS